MVVYRMPFTRGSARTRAGACGARASLFASAGRPADLFRCARVLALPLLLTSIFATSTTVASTASTGALPVASTSAQSLVSRAPQSLADTVAALRPSVVAVGTAYPRRQPIGRKRPNAVLGTGFAVANGRLIVTNDHVIPATLDVDNQQALVVFVGRGNDAEVRVATPLRRDSAHDLALLQISGEALQPLVLGSASGVREGDEVAFTGFPIGAVLGLFPATHRGIVAAITPLARAADSSRDLASAQLSRLRDPFEVFQLDAIAYPGNSGSPVYLPVNGEVIGVINSVFVKESRETLLQRPSGISYAIPVRHLRALLDGIPEAP